MPRIVSLDALQQFPAVNLSSDPGAIPGPVQIPSCAQIVLHWNTASGKGANNVLYGKYTGAFAGTQTQANAIMTGLTTGGPWTSNLALDLATTTSFASVTIRDVNTINQALIQSNLTAVPGTAAGTEMPDENALVVTLRTALVGPGNRGRLYLVGFTTAAIGTGNTINATVTGHAQTWAGNIFNVFAAQGYQLVLGQKARAAYTSPVTGRVFPARPAFGLPISLITVRDNHWDSQRRRGLR